METFFRATISWLVWRKRLLPMQVNLLSVWYSVVNRITYSTVSEFDFNFPLFSFTAHFPLLCSRLVAFTFPAVDGDGY